VSPYEGLREGNVTGSPEPEHWWRAESDGLRRRVVAGAARARDDSPI
jgi:hypothetical protein